MSLAKSIRSIVDFFYFPFIGKWLPVQKFRYAVCGGANVVAGWVLYYLAYHYVFKEANLELGLVVISPHVAALCFVFPITFITGFLLNKYVTFHSSPLRGRIQLTRYFLSVAGSLAINYMFVKIFVEALGIYPTPSQMLATVFVTVYSYLMQKYFTFRGCIVE